MPGVIAAGAIRTFLISLNMVILLLTKREGLIPAVTIFGSARCIDLHTHVGIVHDSLDYRCRVSL